MDFGTFLLQHLLPDMGSQLVSTTTAAFIIAAIGLNLHFGYTGLINIGQAGFMLAGMYAYALTQEWTGSFWLGLLMAVIVGIVLALILGMPTLHLRGDYFSMVAIAVAEIVRMVSGSPALTAWTGGSGGINGSRYQSSFTAMSPFPAEGVGDFLGLTAPYSGGDSWWLRIVTWIVVAIVLGLTFLLVRSPWGRVLRGIREDEEAMRSLGKNVNMVKMQSLIIGGVFASVAGALYSLAGSVQPVGMGRAQTYIMFTCVLLGGAATVFGPIVGTLLYMVVTTAVIPDLLNTYVPSTVMSQTQVPSFIWILVGIGLMLLVIFRPQGLLGNKRELNFIGG